jgi:hypothetical protein
LRLLDSNKFPKENSV